MKKILFLFIVAFSAINSMFAEDISAERALQIARSFNAGALADQSSLGAKSIMSAEPTMAHIVHSKVSQKDNIYIINLGVNQGFVIVSGETGAEDEVLGYCDHGSFSYTDCPVQLKDLLMQYSDEVDELRKAPTSAAKAQTSVSADIGSIVVGPLLTTTWNQWTPYNSMCPEVDGETHYLYDGRCPTGCYPTAIAQVMNYWKWPKESQGKLMDIYGKFTGEDFSGHTYDWDNMLDSYGLDGKRTNYTSYDGVQANAVAKLMADIGTAFRTSYGKSGSPTHFVEAPLMHNFGYSPDIQENRGKTAADLTRQMKTELDFHRPILYCGGLMTTPEDCHALVCDGYTSTNYFHFNYGWGGASDGWYKNALVGEFASNSIIFTGVYPSSAGSMVINDIEYSLLVNGEAHIKQYIGDKATDAVIDIPDEITDNDGNSYKVTRIWKNAFWNRGHFNKIILGNNLKSIHQYSFIQSTIDSLIIGDKVQDIPDGAFQLTRIKYLEIGASLKRIGKQAFRMCALTNVICKSPAIELDDEAFMMGGTGTSEGDGEWLEHVTKLGTNVFQGSSFAKVPRFTNLEEMGPTAIQASFPEEDFPYVYDGITYYAKRRLFHIYPKLRKVSPTSFVGCNLDGFIMEGESPYFSIHRNEVLVQNPSNMLFNNDGSSLVATTPETFNKPSLPGGSGSYSTPVFRHYSDNVVRLEPGSIVNSDATGCIIDIPTSVVEMEGAFTNCERILMLYCFHNVPPAISDSTFNDKIFLKSSWIYIPKGSEELYRKAPGWRRFKEFRILSDYGYQESDYTPQGRQYDMIVHYTDEKGHHSVSVPVSEVGNMQMDESGGKVVVSRSGQQNLTIDVAQMDSITWENGLIYDRGEVFSLNDSTLIAKSQYCTVTLGPTVIDKDAELTIRNAVLMPKIEENMVRYKAVDISLSTGEHELTGTATITIPFEKREGEKLKAVYFNPETGEWEPTYFWYDEDQRAVVILTNHFSIHGVCSLVEEHTPRVKQEKYDLGIYDLTESIKKIYDIVSKDNIDESAVQAFRDDYGFWQSIGLDCGWNGLQALGFQPEDVSNACDIVGYLGTALTVLDVAAADLKGDDIGVVSNSLKAINGFVTGKLASAIGTSVMQVSMVGVAVIGIMLEKFGTMVQERKKELIRAAYRHYYSMEGVHTVWNFTKYRDGDLSQDYFGREQKYPNHQYRSKKDWYMYLKTPLEEGKIKPENFKLLIEQAVRRYCDRFWEDTYDARSACYQEAKSWGLTSQLDAEDNISLQQQISDEYFNELMNGDIMEVFQQLRLYCEEAAGARVQKYERDLQALMNSTMTLSTYDSSKQKDVKSKFAGWKLRFAEVPDDINDLSEWECTIGEDGTAKMECTKYALAKYNMHLKYILTDDRGIDQKVFEYKIPKGSGKFSAKLDLATGGKEVEAPELKGLELDYDPLMVLADITFMGTFDNGNQYNESTTEGNPVFLNNYMNKNARFQTEIEKYFKQHDFITVDQYGDIRIGDDIAGKMEGEQGTGRFTINTTHSFVEQAIPDYVEATNKSSGFDAVSHNLLDGTIEHKIDCQFTLTRIPDSEEYTVSYDGEGTYSFKANIVGIVEGVDFDNFGTSWHVITEQVHPREVTQEGSVKLRYVTKLR